MLFRGVTPRKLHCTEGKKQQYLWMLFPCFFLFLVCSIACTLRGMGQDQFFKYEYIYLIYITTVWAKTWLFSWTNILFYYLPLNMHIITKIPNLSKNVILVAILKRFYILSRLLYTFSGITDSCYSDRFKRWIIINDYISICNTTLEHFALCNTV